MIRKCHHFPMPINGHGSAVGMASVATNTFQRDDWTLNLKQTGVSVLMVIEEHSRALRIRREKKKKRYYPLEPRFQELETEGWLESQRKQSLMIQGSTVEIMKQGHLFSGDIRCFTTRNK